VEEGLLREMAVTFKERFEKITLFFDEVIKRAVE